MAVQNIVLYGSRLFASSNYSVNDDPESLSLNLSDSSSLTDNGSTEQIIKAISDAITGADARIIANGVKPLSDSSTLTETIAKALAHAFDPESISLGDTRTVQAVKALPPLPTITAGFPIYGALNYTESQYGANATNAYDGQVFLLESIIEFLAIKALTDSLTMIEQRIFNATVALIETLLITDASVDIDQIKGLSDFVLLKDWLQIQLQRANIWTSTAAYESRNSTIHLYGPGVYYGVDFYAANPIVNWYPTEPSTTVWQNNETIAHEEALYAECLYTECLYGSAAIIGWTMPGSTAQQAWTNNNGESHN